MESIESSSKKQVDEMSGLSQKMSELSNIIKEVGVMTKETMNSANLISDQTRMGISSLTNMNAFILVSDDMPIRV